MDEDVPDPRTEAHDICGASFIGSTGIEWVCVKKVHAKVYPSKRDGIKFQETGTANQHHYVNKWPNRPTHQPD